MEIADLAYKGLGDIVPPHSRAFSTAPSACYALRVLNGCCKQFHFISCPKEHSVLNARQFPIVAQTYFGVAQECLEGMVGQKILQKLGRGGRSQRETICDAFGENLVKATLPGGWTYHHDGINVQLHRIFRQAGMTIDMEVEDSFLRKLRETAINPVTIVPLLSKNLEGYVPDGRQTGIANGKYPAGIDQFTEVKVIHNGTVQYDMPDVRDDPQGSSAENKF